MLGQSKRNVPNRPELIEQYGWDVKYGSHALRLAYQGHEIASTGALSLPLPQLERERVLAVKRGQVPRDEVSAEIGRLEAQVRPARRATLSAAGDRRRGGDLGVGDQRAAAALGLVSAGHPAAGVRDGAATHNYPGARWYLRV